MSSPIPSSLPPHPVALERGHPAPPIRPAPQASRPVRTGHRLWLHGPVSTLARPGPHSRRPVLHCESPAPLNRRAALAAFATALTIHARSGPAATRPLRLLALGDSLTAGYGLAHQDGFVARLQAALDAVHADTTVLDAGVSGDTSTDALARLDWVMGDRPDAALVELGGNDGLRGLDLATMERNLRAIIGRLQQAHLPVLVSGMLAPPNMGPRYGAQFKAVFDRIALIPGILYEPFFLDGVAGHPDLQQADRIHPDPRGVDVIVRRILPLVLSLLAEARHQPA